MKIFLLLFLSQTTASITNFTTFPAVGQNLTYWCEYPNYTLINKFICKGEDPSICKPPLSTQRNKTIGRFSMQEEQDKRKITITVRNVTTDDTGTYWCGAETTDKTHSNKFFQKLVMTVGHEVLSKVKGCPVGWIQFTCKYPKPNVTYESIDLVNPKETIRSALKNVWENNGRVFLYHDPKKKHLRVAINKTERENFGKYTCKFNQLPDSCDTVELDLDVETDGCQGQFIQTAYRTAKTTIACDYTGNKYKFFCKQKGSICEDILSTKSSLKSNGTFTLTETNSSFSVSISNVSSRDAGVYWCGVETHEGSYRAALRKIQLKVKASITNFTTFPTVGQNLTYWCRYPNYTLINKFICKGEDPSICEPLLSTQRNKTIGRFSMKEEQDKRNITITVRDVTTDDTGTYWCGAETTDKTHSNKFFHKLVMTVVSPAVSTNPATSSPSVTKPATVSYGGFDRTSVLTIAVALSLDVLLLLLMLTTYFVYTRFSGFKNTRTEA